MLEIVQNTIKLTRGDSVSFSVSMRNGEEEYELQEGDFLTFTVRKNVYASEKLIEKVLTTSIIDIVPADTKLLPFGDYVYDVELTFQNGDVNTIIPPSLFRIMEEVSYE